MDDILAGFFNWVIDMMFSLTGATAEQLQITDATIASISDVWDYFIMMGIGLTVVFFILDLNKRWGFEGQSLTLKTMMIPMLKLVIAVILMIKAGTIFSFICDFNNIFANALENMDFAKGIKMPTENGTAGDNIMKVLGFWEKIIMIFPLVIGFAVGIICNLVWAYKALIYKIELIVRVGFAPIALADIYSGLNASAIKYIRGTLALVLYGGCLIILPRVTLAVGAASLQDAMDTIAAMASGTDLSNGISNVFNVILQWFSVIICPIAGIGLTGAAKTLTKEAMGA